MKILARMTIAFVAIVAVAQAQTTWTPELQLKVKAVGAPRVSPDGRRVVYTVNEAVMTADRSEFVTQIWMATTDGRARSAMTSVVRGRGSARAAGAGVAETTGFAPSARASAEARDRRAFPSKASAISAVPVATSHFQAEVRRGRAGSWIDARDLPGERSGSMAICSRSVTFGSGLLEADRTPRRR